MEKENIFEDTEVLEEQPTVAPDIDEDPTEEEWQPMISSESPKDKIERLGVKKEMDGKILTVKGYFFTKPRTKNPDGTKIEPKKTQQGDKAYYPGKLGIRFEENNLVEYYPSFHYFVNDDKISNFAKINRTGNNAISKLFTLILAKIGKPSEEVSDKEIFDYLVGNKVKIKTEKGTFLGKNWFRNDIVEILD